LTVADVPAAFELSCEAGWNQTLEDWRMLIELGPEGCFAIECDGRLAATTTLIRYGRRLAWLGMVLTGAEYRRRGFARSLVKRALELADAKGIETVKLDATEQGQPLYESLGFKAERPVERWSAKTRALRCANNDYSASAASIALLDRDAFPADRSEALRSLFGRGKAFVSPQGYLLQRPGHLAAYLGPCVSASSEAAEQLIKCCLAESEGPWFWDLFPGNSKAVAIAAKFGFQPQRTLVRMYRGRELREPEQRIYAIAGFELG
jgi:RimJ/RimL family protein N-acetyltransferase